MGWRELAEAVVRERGARLTAYAALFAAADADAEDLVQDALIRVFARNRGFSTVNEAEAYIRRSIPSAAIDRARSRASRRRAVDRSYERPAAGADVDAGLDVRAALRQLSPRQRYCVVLKYFDDLTVAQVAARLGVAEGTVKRHLADATSRLAPLLGLDDKAIEANEMVDVIASPGKE